MNTCIAPQESEGISLLFGFFLGFFFLLFLQLKVTDLDLAGTFFACGSPNICFFGFFLRRSWIAQTSMEALC